MWILMLLVIETGRFYDRSWYISRRFFDKLTTCDIHELSCWCTSSSSGPRITVKGTWNQKNVIFLQLFDISWLHEFMIQVLNETQLPGIGVLLVMYCLVEKHMPQRPSACKMNITQVKLQNTFWSKLKTRASNVKCSKWFTSIRSQVWMLGDLPTCGSLSVPSFPV